MYRKQSIEFKNWFQSPSRDRLPLIIRGPRQVGKTSLVKQFALEHHLDFFEINLEKVTLKSLQAEKISIEELLDEIESKFKKRPTINSLLFFDEIQAEPKLIGLLRYFYEDYSQIAVVAAGSLLELVLKKEDISFPVGRVRFLYMTPMTFSEFLAALDESFYLDSLNKNKIKPFMHDDLIKLVKKFFFIGGMPKCIATYIETKSIQKVREVQLDIIETYRSDFPKYGKRLDYKRIDRIFYACALNVGKKVIYQNFDKESRSREIKNALEMLTDAMIITPCLHSDCSGIPIDASISEDIYKIYFVDIGIMNAIHKLDYHTLDSQFNELLLTKGTMAEQFIAQHLQQFYSDRTRPELRYWLRNKSTNRAEVDFVVQANNKIFPIEVKAEKGGKLKSLIVFSSEKKSSQAIVFNAQPEDTYQLKSRYLSEEVEIQIQQLPFYFVEYLTDKMMNK